MRKFIFLLLAALAWCTTNFAQKNTRSALADGEIYKLSFNKPGVYKLDYNFLKNTAKIDVDRIDPRQLKIYGNGGGMMPGKIAGGYQNTERDLAENRIFVAGEGDGKFDAGDYILMYAEGPEKWIYNTTTETFSFPKNAFDTKNCYFLKISAGNGLRVESRASLGSAAYATATFDDFIRYEDDRSNLLEEWVSGQGSGQDFYGDQFKNTRSRTYSEPLVFPNIDLNTPVKFRVEMAARAFGNSSYYKVDIDGESFLSSNFSSVGSGDSDNTYAFIRSVAGEIMPSGEQITVNISYPPTSYDSEAWLDYIELNARRNLRMTGSQLFFRDAESLLQPSVEFRLSGATANLEVWDITDPLSPKIQEASLAGDQLTFALATGGALKEFIAFDKTTGFSAPAAVEKVDNQNLHGLTTPDMVIIYHKDFEEAAKMLAEHRRSFSKFGVETVEINKIYNEFSSGRMDPVGVRDFAKMLFDRDTNRFRYLLLLGDGTFDSRDIYKKGGNFIPTYETIESLDPVDAFPADDYYGLLTNGEGGDLSGYLDIAIGRIPVETAEEATNVVKKIIKYDSDPMTVRDWRNRLVFVSDDEDGTSHIGPSEEIADDMARKYPNFNIKKIYADAFQQVSTSGGQKYPDVNEAIDKSIFKGALAINYFGHGGPKGWAQERILRIESILNWDNFDRLPLFVTATCSFTGFDKPGAKSAGEQVLLNPRGGAIALYSTTRAVYVSGNIPLTQAAFDRLFEKVNGVYPTIGEIFTRAKNESGAGFTNSRKFNLFGDPAMHLALPKYSVATTKINIHDVADAQPDTLRALQKVTIEGYVADNDGNVMTDFNGAIYPSIFDKRITAQTLGQDRSSPIFPFDVQDNVLFKGRASVENGRFSFTFVMPKDINYDYGAGKISYFAENGQLLDAAGNYQNIIIGKTDPNALADNEGPKVEVFMNTDDFVFGGITNPDPVILVKLVDDNGINVAGTSIGHDLIAVLDDDTRNTFVLNDFYEASLNDFTKGEARYPLFKLAEGRHKVKVVAWDVANNSGEGFTEFVVANTEKAALQHVLNYPNPFTDRTYFLFEHNLAGQPVEIQVQVYSIAGRLVKTIEKTLMPAGHIIGQNESLEWDGTDDYGAPLSRGVYVYRIKIKGAESVNQHLKGESEFEKLVIMK